MFLEGVVSEIGLANRGNPMPGGEIMEKKVIVKEIDVYFLLDGLACVPI